MSNVGLSLKLESDVKVPDSCLKLTGIQKLNVHTCTEKWVQSTVCSQRTEDGLVFA